MTAPAYVQKKQLFVASATPGPDTITLGAASTSGNLLILAVLYANGQTVTTPAGWTRDVNGVTLAAAPAPGVGAIAYAFHKHSVGEASVVVTVSDDAHQRTYLLLEYDGPPSAALEAAAFLRHEENFGPGYLIMPAITYGAGPRAIVGLGFMEGGPQSGDTLGLSGVGTLRTPNGSGDSFKRVGAADLLVDGSSGSIPEYPTAGNWRFTFTDIAPLLGVGLVFTELPGLDCAFSATPLSGINPLTVEFTDETTGIPDGWLWDFGDGETSTDQNPTHEYLEPGVYDVTLTVTRSADDATCDLTITDYVVVRDAEAWDVFASDDLNGPIIATLTETEAREFRKELRGPGSGAIKLNRHNPIATEAILAEGNLVRCRIPEHGPDYLFSWFIGPGDHTILSPAEHIGGEMLALSGPGGITYLDRARMTQCAFTLDDILTGTWTKVWATGAIARPVGAAFDPDQSGYVYVGGLSSRRVRKLNQSTRAVVSSSPALWSGSEKAMGGISFDPDDDGILWALEAPWLLGSSANTKIRKVDRSDWSILDTYDLGSDVQLTDIRVDGDYVWTSRYDNDRIQQRSKADPTTVVDSFTVTYKGKLQKKPNGIAINGTKIAYWFGGDLGGGTGRALIADTSDPDTVTGVQDTKNVSAFGGEWTTEGGEDFLYAVSYTLGKTWKYQLTDAEPACADADGYLTPEQTSPGAIANRVLLEITDADRTDDPVPDLTWDFDATLDSDGNAWPASTATEIFRWRVGERAYSDVLMRLIPYGIDFEMDPNVMVLHAYVAKGVDRTGGAFGAGVVRFEEGESSNIVGELRRRADAPPVDTHMTAKGDGKTYGSAEMLDRPYVREGFIEVSGVTATTILDARAAAELVRQRLVADAIAIPHSWIAAADDIAGEYLAGKHYDTGDTCTVHSGASDWDYDETDWRVYAYSVVEISGGGWSQLAELGSAYRVDTSPGAGGGTPGSAGASGGGAAIAASLVVQRPDESVVVSGVKTIVVEGVTSPAPGVAVIPSGGDTVETNLEDLPTGETDTTLVPHPDGTGGVVWGMDAGGTAWFNVLDYGATGDGSTDDTTAVDDAIAALNAAGGGVLYFPAGNYKCTAALTTISVTALILGDGHGYADSHGDGGSEVRQTSSTAKLFTVTATGTRFHDIGLRCTAATPTAGSGINAQADFVRYDNVAVSNFYDCIDHETGAAWKMDGCWIVGAVRYGLRVRNTSSPDGGDQAISNSWFYADQRNGSAAIRLESGGGTKVTNCKINTFVSGHRWVRGIDVAPTATTTILIVDGNSIENYSGDGVHYDDSVSGGSWDQLIIVNNQFGQYGNGTGKAISIDGANDVHVGGGVFRADTGTPTAISLSNGTRALVEPFVNHGFGTLLATSSYTSVDDRTTASSGAPTTADYLVGTAQAGLSAEIVVGTTPGGELGGSWAVPTVDATHSGSAHADFIAKAIVDAKGDLIAATAADTVARVPVGTDGQLLKADSAAAAGVSWVDAPASSGSHAHVVSETHLSDGASGLYTLDQNYESGSVIAWNVATLARLTVTETEPDQATVSPVGSAGDAIVFDYAATLV